jgi:hypothetical protein
MNLQRCLTIADRIHCLLQAELDQGIDTQRMVADPLYARDVLLVCEGFVTGDLPHLARQFRSAVVAPPADARAAVPPPAAVAAARPARESGRLSDFFNSIFGPSTAPPSTLEPPPAPPAARRPTGHPREPGL